MINLDEYQLKVMDQIKEKTRTDCEIENDSIKIESIISAIEDLLSTIESQEKEIEKLENYDRSEY